MVPSLVLPFLEQILLTFLGAGFQETSLGGEFWGETLEVPENRARQAALGARPLQDPLRQTLDNYKSLGPCEVYYSSLVRPKGGFGNV